MTTDELLALAAAATQPLKLRRYDNGGGRMSDAATDRVLVADFYQEADREFYAALDPATITAHLTREAALEEALATAKAELMVMRPVYEATVEASRALHALFEPSR